MSEALGRRGPSRLRLALAAALTAGALFRTIAYGERSSLSLDEARLSLAIASQSFAGLLQPLSYDQAAPPLFLWAEKLAVILGGVNEYALRALPLIAGLAVPGVTYAFARRVVDRRTAAIAAALTALSPGMVLFSVQVKPYQTDALLCMGLLWIFAVESERAPHQRPGPWTIGLGTVGVWCSVAVPFALAAIGLASWFDKTAGRAQVARCGCGVLGPFLRGRLPRYLSSRRREPVPALVLERAVSQSLGTGHTRPRLERLRESSSPAS